jgi:hypothetical protein
MRNIGFSTRITKIQELVRVKKGFNNDIARGFATRLHAGSPKGGVAGVQVKRVMRL